MHNDKDHQMLFVCGPQQSQNGERLPPSWKSKFAMVTQIVPFHLSAVKVSIFFENPRRRTAKILNAEKWVC